MIPLRGSPSNLDTGPSQWSTFFSLYSQRWVLLHNSTAGGKNEAVANGLHAAKMLVTAVYTSKHLL